MPRVTKRQEKVQCVQLVWKNPQHTNLCTEIQNGKGCLDVSKELSARKRKGEEYKDEIRRLNIIFGPRALSPISF